MNCVIDADGSEHRLLARDAAEDGRMDVPFKSCWGMVITQSCDLDNDSKDLITVARIKVLQEVLSPNQINKGTKSIVGDFKNPGKRPQYLYLPSHSEVNFPASFVYLLELESFPRIDYDQIQSMVKMSLSHESLSALQERLSYCYGRYAAEDDLYYTSDEWSDLKSG